MLTIKKLKNKLKNFWHWIILFGSAIAVFFSSILLIFYKIIDCLTELFSRYKQRKVFGSLVAAGILLLFSLFYFRVVTLPMGNPRPVAIIINHGDSVQKIALQLKEARVISNSNFFILLCKLFDWDREIHAGRYDFSDNYSIFRVLRKLTQGGATAINVVIPEGATLKQIAGILQKEINLDSSLFVQIASDKNLADSLKIPGKTLEGYLFPNTYNFYWQQDIKSVIFRMLEEFRKTVFDSLKFVETPQLGLKKLVTLASLIEKESKRPDELPLISAVFYNRLKIDMPLQCDPTVSYGLGLNRPVKPADLQVKHPYNTYIYYGLPPGPICNPGTLSLRAVLTPAPVSYLYFVAKRDGYHIFSNTLDEHNQAIYNMIKERKAGLN